jgi:hypothetical protein
VSTLKPSQLTKRIEELSQKLKPVASEGIRIEFTSFTEPEQLVLLKNFDLDDKYRGNWTHETILENKDLILKGNHIVISRVIELFQFVMPRALMLDELEQWFFKFNFNDFLERWIECQKNLSKWSKKDRQEFLRDIKIEPKTNKKNKHEVLMDGEENNN